MRRKENITWDKALGTRKPYWLFLAMAVNLPLILYTALGTLEEFPNSGDEYAYLLSARLFSERRLSAPSPEPRAFFDTSCVVNNGTYYGKYPPGWPALLTLGVWAGVPWAVNPILGMLTLAAVYFFARNLFSQAAANAAMAFTLLNPYFIFNSASYFSHTSCLLAATVGAWFLLRPRPGFWASLGFGACAGFIFLTRPFTAILVFVPLVAYALAEFWKRGDWKGFQVWGWGAVWGFAPFFTAFLLYDAAQTGNPFLQPFEVYDPTDHLGFHGVTYSNSPLERFQVNILDRLWFLTKWTGGAPLWAVLFFLFPKTKEGFYGRCLALAASFGLLLAGYYFYWGTGGNQYGPRYLYESYAFLIVAAALGALCFKRWAPVVLAVVLVFNLSKFAQTTDFYRQQIRERTEVFNLAEKSLVQLP